MSQSRRVALALVLVGAVAFAGCAAQSQDAQYPSESEVADSLGSIRTVEADVVSQTWTAGNETTRDETTARMHVVQNFERDASRSTITAGQSRGVTTVSNESTVWYYQPRWNSVHVIDAPTIERSTNRTVRMVSSIYDSLEDGENPDESVGISPAPTVPAAPPEAAPSGQGLTLPLGENLTVSAAGRATIDGRETRVVEVGVPDEAGLIQHATYWIDTEWHFPIRTRIGVQVGNETTVSTTTYRNVSFNEPAESTDFTFDPLATTRVAERLNESGRQYDGREALAAATDRSVPDPSLPAAYEFDAARLGSVDTDQSTTIVYAGDEDTITVTKVADARSTLRDDGRVVDVAGEEGRIVSIGANRAVVWTCGGSTYSVVGVADDEVLLDVAASMACE